MLHAEVAIPTKWNMFDFKLFIHKWIFFIWNHNDRAPALFGHNGQVIQ